MFAVLKTGGKQYKVAKDDKLTIERIYAEPGEAIQFNEVLMVGGDKVTVGAPLVDGAAVQAEVLEQIRGPKLINFVKRRRKHSSQRKKGHRQYLTTVKITEILEKGAEKSGVKAAIGTGAISAAALGGAAFVTEKATKKKAAPKKSAKPAAKKEEPKKAAPKKEAKKEEPKKAAPKKEAKKEEPKKAAPKKEAAPKAEKKEAPKKAAPKAEKKAAPKKAAPKKEAAKDTGKPANLLAKPKGEKDDLKEISGVGPKLEDTLNKQGVWHFWQIAEWKKADVEMMDDLLSFKGRIDRDEWIKQAKKLAKG